MARIDAEAKALGETRYAGDIQRPGLCHGALVLSPFAHARIVGIEAAEALGVPGVLSVITGPDLGKGTFGRMIRDIPPLAQDVVRYAGERVALVVGETREAADRGATRVQVDYEPLDAVLDMEEALVPGAPSVHEAAWRYPQAVAREEDHPNLQSHTRIAHGADVDIALARSAHVIEEVYRTPAAHHGYMEPQAALAELDADGIFHLWVCTKSPYRLRDALGDYFGLEPQSIVLHPVALGGDFGGKGTSIDALLCMAAARRVGRPVRIALSYGNDLVATETRHASRLRVRAGCDRGGRLTAISIEALFDGGAYAGYKPTPTVDLSGIRHALGAYRVPAVQAESRIVYSNRVPAGHMRAPGSPQTAFAVESALDELARRAGFDPFSFREQNLLDEQEANAWGHKLLEVRAKPTLQAARAAHRPADVPVGWRHGVGVAIADHATSSGRMSLSLRPEAGGFVCEVPFPETGTGGHTVVRELLARALGVSASSIQVRQVSTAALPYDSGIGGSRLTGGFSLAAEELAAAYLARGGKEAVTVDLTPERGQEVTSYCVQIADVAVDPETGQVRVLQLLSAVDVAEIVNPAAHQMQIEGGMAMGYGFATMEDLQIEEGRVTAANLGEFKIPSARDLPALRVELVRGGRGLGAANVKAVGELTNVPTAAAIANAVADAVGVRVREAPITAERVWKALQADLMKTSRL